VDENITGCIPSHVGRVTFFATRPINGRGWNTVSRRWCMVATCAAGLCRN